MLLGSNAVKSSIPWAVKWVLDHQKLNATLRTRFRSRNICGLRGDCNQGYRSICLKASCAPLFAKTARGPHSKPERCSRLSLWNGFLPPAKQAILNEIQLWPSQSSVFCTPSPTTSSCFTTAVLKCLVLAPGRFSQPPISFFMAATVILALLTMLTAVLACYMWFNWVPAFSLKAPEHWP